MNSNKRWKIANRRFGYAQKITLAVEELNQIIVNHLASIGQIEPRVANIRWNVNRFSPEIFSGVTVEQNEIENS